jgi:hypothetical protein
MIVVMKQHHAGKREFPDQPESQDEPPQQARCLRCSRLQKELGSPRIARRARRAALLSRAQWFETQPGPFTGSEVADILRDSCGDGVEQEAQNDC